MNGLSCGEESMTICSAVLIQYQRVTDGWTDGQTDVQPISITCFSIADARKNYKNICTDSCDASVLTFVVMFSIHLFIDNQSVLLVIVLHVLCCLAGCTSEQ